MTRYLFLTLGMVLVVVTAVVPATCAQATGVAVSASVGAMIRAGVTLKPSSLLDSADVSPLHMTAGPQLGDGMLCLRTHGDRGVGYFAVFFERGKIIDYRRAVAIDHCTDDSYAPLPSIAAVPSHHDGKTHAVSPDATRRD